MNKNGNELNIIDYENAIKYISEPITRRILMASLKNGDKFHGESFERDVNTIILRLKPKLTLLYVFLSVLSLGLLPLVRLIKNGYVSLPHSNSYTEFKNGVDLVKGDKERLEKAKQWVTHSDNFSPSTALQRCEDLRAKTESLEVRAQNLDKQLNEKEERVKDLSRRVEALEIKNGM